MTQGHLSFRALSDCDLIHEVMRLAGREQQATAHLVAALAEFDARRLYRGEGCSSTFTYCTNVLHLSDSAAYRRIQAARTATRFPVIFDLLASGDLTVTNVELLSPVLTEENHEELLREARHRSKREVEMLVARLNPRPDAPSIITPLAEDRFKVQFTITGETHDKLRRAQDLLRHVVPNGDLGVVFDRALDRLLPALERTKHGKARRPRQAAMTLPWSRYISRAVRRAVWERDGGQCAFVGPQGRCTEKGLLEFHHVRPFALGGRSDVSNIELRCRAHNQYEADVLFGGASVAREAPAAAWGDDTCTGGVPAAPDRATLQGLCVSSRRTARAHVARERLAPHPSVAAVKDAG
jgi:5-methylcytosine-specific restriction endonuclease McrA